MMFILGCCFGMFFVFCVVLIFREFSIAGTLKIDSSNPEKDIYRLEIDDLNRLPRKKRITVKVESSQLDSLN